MKRIVVVAGLTLLLQDTLDRHHQRLSPVTIGGEVPRKPMTMKGRMTVVVVGGAEDSPWLERDLSRIFYDGKDAVAWLARLCSFFLLSCSNFFESLLTYVKYW